MEQNDFVEINSIKFTLEDINLVVKKFYTKVEIDPYLRGPFNVVDDWPHHIDRLTHFWWVRMGGRAYMDAQYNPVQKHYETGFSEELLDHWLTLFKNVLKETLSPEQSQIWTNLAEGMGAALNRNNELMKLHYSHKK